MTNSINLIAFGTFGNPNGFKQTFFVGSKELAKSVKTFDLNTNAIKLFANSKVYAIRKEYANGFNTIAYSVYSYAREQNSDRSGTFIGSSILYTNKIAKEHITIAQLNEFHNQLVNKNVSNDTISVNHSDKFSVVKPKDFDKIEFHLREIENLNFRQNSDNYLVVFCNINDNNLNQFFEKSIDLLNVYDTIYFTDNQEIAEFAHQKGIFKLIQNVGEKREFEIEISNLIEERKRKREQSISEFEREVQRISEDKIQTIQEFKNQIEQSERIHLENERKLKESKEDVNKIGQFYDDFLNKTKNLINQLRHNNGKLEEVKQIHNSNKILFNNGISDLKRPNYTTTIAKPKPKGNLHTEHQRQDFEHRGGHKRREERDELELNDFKIDIYKVATLVLAFLLIITWVYFLFFKSNSVNETEVIQNKEQVNPILQEEEQKPDEITKIEDLNPKSNSILNENDFRIVAKNLKPNMKLEDVVKVIFTNNPTEISSVYFDQEAIYSKHLLELNKQCFEEKEGIYYFAKDTLRQIPSYKK
ncbi:MAG: hypothetical protein ACOVQR_02905 [Flavobacterium sp.]|jgi:hypothetical protein|uniref:hypothetical protein n=1 Tax=Flavobacterium sp. TaxID=239 RepID=UPI003BA4F828